MRTTGTAYPRVCVALVISKKRDIDIELINKLITFITIYNFCFILEKLEEDYSRSKPNEPNK